MDFLDVIKTRRSIRSFKEKEVEKEKLEKLFELLNYAPSAGNLQAFKVIVVKNKELKEKIYFACLEQESILEAPICLIFIALPEESAKKYGERGLFYSMNDACIAASYSQLIAHYLGLSTVWIGAFEDKKLTEALNLTEKEKPIAVMPLGYANEKPSMKPRKKIEDLVEERD